jgi:hypothetical protein
MSGVEKPHQLRNQINEQKLATNRRLVARMSPISRPTSSRL